jgi:hypothetical protein
MLNSLAHTAIESIQTGKKFVVTQTVKYEPLANILNSFVDAQTSYTKSFYDTTLKSFSDFGDLLLSRDFTNNVMEAYTPFKQPKTVMKAASRKAK